MSVSHHNPMRSPEYCLAGADSSASSLSGSSLIADSIRRFEASKKLFHARTEPRVQPGNRPVNDRHFLNLLLCQTPPGRKADTPAGYLFRFIAPQQNKIRLPEYLKICFGRAGMAQIEVSSKELMQTTFTITGDFTVPRIGYGAMRLTGQPNNYGPYVDWEAGKQLLCHGVELGIRFIDTARAYGPGWNERLVADALAPYPDDLFIATKGGVVKKTVTARFLDGSPEGLRRDCEDSLQNLRVDCINLYQLHWVDADVPLADSVAGLAALQKQGKIRRIGLCNVTLARVKEALSITPIASVQNRYSVADRQSDAIVEFCDGQGILFIPYGPLGADPMKPGAPLASAGG